MTASVSDHLLDALDDLDTDELKRFKWRLKNHKGFSKTALQKADAPDTVDLMMKCFGSEEAVRLMVDILRKMNQNHVAEQLEKKHKQVSFTNIVPRTRNDFLQYSHRLTLDLNTAHKCLRLSEENTVITYTYQNLQLYPDHPDRFDHWEQVLCRESACGRCYWEIEWSGRVSISVSYMSIRRKGWDDKCVFGSNDQSWSLICSRSRYSFRHNNRETEPPVESISRRVGVYVDHSAGTLSFYSVSGDTMSLIHTVQTTFTQPLYPGFGVYSLSSVKLC